ncbi:hypothetical protein E2I00_007262, partial [Balaenoptera physalus]
ALLPLPRHPVAGRTMAQTDILLTKEPAPQTYLVDEWFQNCYARYHQAFADLDQSEQQHHESQQLAAETEALAQRTQQDSTKKVRERLQDMHCWKSELQRQVEELVAETDLLLAQKQRLERTLDATAVPFSIATDNLQCRERRQHPDLVRDCVEMELLKEADLIRNIQELLKRTMMQAVNQIRMNHEHKETCEMDWSDKVEACNIDEACCRYHNQSTDLQFYPHSAKFEERASEQGRLLNVAQGLGCGGGDPQGLSCVQTLREIMDQEHNVAALKQAIRDKEAPLKVAQTRLYQRSHRPNVELCRDAVQFSLEKDIAVKTNSLFIDRQKCMAHRTRYPTVLQLAGYQ